MYFRDEECEYLRVDDAPEKTCPRCGKSYKMLEKALVDTWNLGHYGCDSIEKCPKIHVGWYDPGCKSCEKELEELQLKAVRKIKEEFWSQH